MEAEGLNDENTTSTQGTTIQDTDTQSDTSLVRMSRSRNRSSPQSRTPRNVTTSGSQRRGSNSRGARNPLRKPVADQTRTPQQPISKYFVNVDSPDNPDFPDSTTKRKDMASTPENVTECKSQRHDSSNGT